MGSPPLVRERHFLTHLIDSVGRITPACAGTTHIVRFFQCGFEDHPRLCGNDEFPFIVAG